MRPTSASKSLVENPEQSRVGMSIIEDLLSGLKLSGPVHDVRIGPHWTSVAVSTAAGLRGGIAGTAALEHHCRGQPCVREAGTLLGRDALTLAQLARSDSGVERSVGLATINALLNVDQATCVEVNAGDIIVKHGAGKQVAIVGHFPFVHRVRQAAGALWVLELRPLGEDLPASRAADVIPQADVVGITGSTLLNQTFEGLLSLCQPSAYIVVMGGSTPLSPLFFDHGVNAVAGAQVVDVDAVLRAVSQGATFRQIPGKRLLTMYG